DKAEPKITARKKFPDTAYWNPELVTDSTGHASVQFELPDNLTTWRATAVAHTADTALGRETNKIVVAKEFFVRLETPRFMTQNDESQILAIVHNDTPARQTALIRLRTENLTIGGTEQQSMSIDPGKTGPFRWPVTAKGFGD